MRYQPKGGMCRVCRYKFNDCSKLDFKSMQKLQITQYAVIVKCSSFDREKSGEGN